MPPLTTRSGRERSPYLPYLRDGGVAAPPAPLMVGSGIASGSPSPVDVVVQGRPLVFAEPGVILLPGTRISRAGPAEHAASPASASAPVPEEEEEVEEEEDEWFEPPREPPPEPPPSPAPAPVPAPHEPASAPAPAPAEEPQPQPQPRSVLSVAVQLDRIARELRLDRASLGLDAFLDAALGKFATPRQRNMWDEADLLVRILDDLG
jgi:hypothetical protein